MIIIKAVAYILANYNYSDYNTVIVYACDDINTLIHMSIC